jgi:hypothetical protein
MKWRERPAAWCQPGGPLLEDPDRVQGRICGVGEDHACLQSCLEVVDDGGTDSLAAKARGPASGDPGIDQVHAFYGPAPRPGGPHQRSVVRELDGTDAVDDTVVPGGEFVAEELIVEVIPQAEDELTCHSCFLVRHRSQIAREQNGHAYCIECEG